MSNRTKYGISACVTFCGLGIALKGFADLYGSSGAHQARDIPLLFIGAIIGISGGVLYTIYRSKKNDSLDKNKIAVETLARLSLPADHHKQEGVTSAKHPPR